MSIVSTPSNKQPVIRFLECLPIHAGSSDGIIIMLDFQRELLYRSLKAELVLKISRDCQGNVKCSSIMRVYLDWLDFKAYVDGDYEGIKIAECLYD